MDRRDFLWMLGSASAAGMFTGCTSAGLRPDPYEFYFREPNVNIGIASAKGRPPHLVGTHLLSQLRMGSAEREAHAFTYLDFSAAARQFGRVGGFAHLKTLVDSQRMAVVVRVIHCCSMVAIPGRAPQRRFGRVDRTWLMPAICSAWMS